MELLQNAFNIILYKPLFNALVLLYQYFPGHDFGIAVIILTIIIRSINKISEGCKRAPAKNSRNPIKI